MVNNTMNNHEDEDEEPHSQVSSLHSGMTATHKVKASLRAVEPWSWETRKMKHDQRLSTGKTKTKIHVGSTQEMISSITLSSFHRMPPQGNLVGGIPTPLKNSQLGSLFPINGKA